MNLRPVVQATPVLGFSLRGAALTLLLYASSAAAHGTHSEPAMMNRPGAKPPANLTSKEAAARRKQIAGDVRYGLTLQLDEKKTTFYGKARVEFFYRPGRSAQDALHLDFDSGSDKPKDTAKVIRQLKINGKVVAKPAYDGNRIELPRRMLRQGENVVEVSYTHPYSTNGDGLHRFKDPSDGEVYLYSNLEPFKANQIFPCFDQPDIKGTYATEVEAPASWQVISSTRETGVRRGKAGKKVWSFPESKRFSSYLYSLIAGPYRAWQDKSSEVPLRLFARKSVASLVRPKEWFTITKEGFKYYNRQFGFKYPFGKYDQVIVPDFNAGAMENVAAVTYAERSLISRAKPTPQSLLSQAEFQLHEMAHMWFGNLVTMKWWDDLWLNESFASFASFLALDHVRRTAKKLRLPDPWPYFTSRMKAWGMKADGLATTHPIAGRARDIFEGQANFDGISYGKGASVLQQLYHYVSPRAFREGLRRYFREYAFGNASRQDFLRSLSEASGKSLDKWQRAWLRRSGTNAVQVELKTRGGKIGQLALEQQADPISKTLRSHKTKVALFYRDGNQLRRRGRPLEVTYEGKRTTVPEAKGLPAPEFVFPNYGDTDFVRVALGPKSLATLRRDLSKIDDKLVRQSLWENISFMVVKAHLPAQELIDLVLSHAASERDNGVLADVLASARGALSFVAPELRREYARKLESLTLRKLRSAGRGTDRQMIFARAFTGLATGRSLNTLRRWLDGPAQVRGMSIDQELRWKIVQTLARRGAKDAETLIAAELRRDNTDQGIKSADLASALIPTAEAKQRTWAKIVGDGRGKPIKAARVRAMLAGFHDPERPELTRPFADAFFEQLPALAHGAKGQVFLDSFSRAAFPAHLTERSVLSKTRALVRAQRDLPRDVVKNLRTNQQLYRERLAAHRLSRRAARPRSH